MLKRCLLSRRLLGALVVSVVSAGTVSVAAPAAQAVSATGSVTMANGVLPVGCWDKDFSWSVSVDAEVTGWELTTSLVDASGRTVGEGSVSGDPRHTRGVGRMTVCQGGAGRYRIETRLDLRDVGQVVTPATLPASTVTFRRPVARTTLQVSDVTPRYHQRLRIRATSQQEDEHGVFRGVWGARIFLIYRYRGEWFRWRGTRVVSERDGGFTYVFRHWDTHRHYRVRAVSSLARTFEAVSPAVRIAKPRPRRG